MDTIGIWGGMFLFSMMSIIATGCFTGTVFALFEIEKKSGWEVVGITLCILAILFIMGLAIYIGGDQIANGYHTYG